MYRAHTINVTNDFRNYNLTAGDRKYIRPQEWEEYEDDLRNGHSMTKYRNANIPIGRRPRSPHKRRANGHRHQPTHKRRANVELSRVGNVEEREIKRHKSAPPPLSTVVLKHPDIEQRKKRIIPHAPQTCKTEKHRKSFNVWLDCWHKVEDMRDKKKKEWRNKEGNPPLDKLVWPEWTPTWRKRKGYMWEWDLPGHKEFIQAFEDREDEKCPYGYQNPFADSDWESEMSDMKEEFSDSE